MYANLNTTAKLTIESDKKPGYYIYKIVDKATGAILATRRSHREYVAATICGGSFFGRVGLAQKCKPFYSAINKAFYQPVIAYLEGTPPFSI